MPKRKDVPGTIYLIHFETPYRHARHYLGWTEEGKLEARILAHSRGQGSRLMTVILAAGIDWRLVRRWDGVTRRQERRLKGHSSTRLCPICMERPRTPRLSAGTGSAPTPDPATPSAPTEDGSAATTP